MLKRFSMWTISVLMIALVSVSAFAVNSVSQDINFGVPVIEEPTEPITISVIESDNVAIEMQLTGKFEDEHNLVSLSSNPENRYNVKLARKDAVKQNQNFDRMRH